MDESRLKTPGEVEEEEESLFSAEDFEDFDEDRLSYSNNPFPFKKWVMLEALTKMVPKFSKNSSFVVKLIISLGQGVGQGWVSAVFTQAYCRSTTEAGPSPGQLKFET